MRGERAMMIGLGCLGLVGAGVLLFAPSMVPPAVMTPLTELVSLSVSPMLIIGIIVLNSVVFLLWRLYATPSVPEAAPPLVDEPPESVQQSVPVVGSDLDEWFTTVEAADRSRSVPPEVETNIRAALQEAAEVAWQQAAGVDQSTAAEAVRTGQWTDDSRVAAFLSPDAPRPSLRIRLFDWLLGRDRLDARMARTLATIEHTASMSEGEQDAEDSTARSKTAPPQSPTPDAAPDSEVNP